MQQLRLTIRRLRRQSGFTVLAVLTLAVGLGANAAIFAVVDAVLLRPLDYPRPDRLVAIEHAAPGLDLPFLEMSTRLYLHYRQHSESFAAIGLYDEKPASISGLDRPLHVAAAAVTPSVLEILAVQPARGRLFSDAEGEPGAPATVIVSQGFLNRHLGADLQVLERTLTIDGVSAQIVGVMPASFAFPSAGIDVWMPLTVDAAAATLGSFGSAGVARLDAKASIETASSELRHLLDDLRTTFPEDQASRVLAESGFTAKLRPFRDVVVGEVGAALWLIFTTVGFVMLLATINVAHLFLARAESRQREMAIRGALGAGRQQLAFAALLEGGLLALAAGVVGLAVGKLALSVLLRLAPGELPRIEGVAIDGRTVAVVALLSLLSGTAFGAVALLRLRLRELASQLKEGSAALTLGRGRHRVRRLLVTAQMAIAIVLLIGAGLMTRSFARLAGVDPGFDAASGLSFRLSLPATAAAENTASARFYELLLTRLRALPGVAAAASTTTLPLTGRTSGSGHRSPEAPGRGEGDVPTVLAVQSISPDYFTTLGIPVVAGRALERADFEQHTGKVVVSQRTARIFWPDDSAIGKRIFPGTPDSADDWLEVVGVVGDVRLENLVDDPPPVIYYPWSNALEGVSDLRQQTIVLRFASDPGSLMKAVRQEVWSLDPNLPLAEIHSLESLLRRARARMAFTSLMLAIAAAVALALGAVGTYGVISFLVTQRTGEIGVRLALGARRGDVLRLVMREGLVLAAAGSLIGLVLAAALVSGLDAVLFAVAPHDPLTFAAVPVVLLLVVVVACLVPARRAASVDPVIALRCE